MKFPKYPAVGIEFRAASKEGKDHGEMWHNYIQGTEHAKDELRKLCQNTIDPPIRPASMNWEIGQEPVREFARKVLEMLQE